MMALFGKRASIPTTGKLDLKPFLVAGRGSDGNIIFHIDPSELKSAGTAGILLADALRHMARAMRQYGTVSSEDEAAAEMMRLFLAEMNSPTDLGSGSIVN
jgi:hypothetical protein